MPQMMPTLWMSIIIMTMMWMKKMILSNHKMNFKKTKIKSKNKMLMW